MLQKKSIEFLMKEKANNPLKKSMGVVSLTFLGIGAIIGTGIFVLTGVAAANYAGPALMISFVISGVAAALAALVYSELATAIPASGSSYTYSYVALGEIFAWILGWNLILEYSVAASAVAVGWSAYLNNLLSVFGWTIPYRFSSSPFEGGLINVPAVAITLMLTFILIRGTKESTVLNTIIVILKLAVILFFLLIGYGHIDKGNWTPFAPFGFGGIMSGAAIIFFAFIGFDAVSTAAEEVKNPKRALPIAIITSLGVSTLLYIAVTIVLTGMVRYSKLNSAAPISTALVLTGLNWASAIIAVGALAGLSSVLLVDIYGQSRIFFVMSRDGLIPQRFSKLHTRYQTPYISTIMVGFLISLIAAFLPIGIIAEMANIGTLSAFVASAVGVIILRKTDPDLNRPFRVPLVPFLPIVSILFSLYLMFNLPRVTWIRFIVWIVIGLIVYFLYSRRHSVLKNESK
jgi:basic amino acid/polyamine antiporter, APA family